MQLYQALITLDGWTFLAQICNLMIQLVIFKKLLLNPVKKSSPSARPRRIARSRTPKSCALRLRP